MLDFLTAMRLWHNLVFLLQNIKMIVSTDIEFTAIQPAWLHDNKTELTAGNNVDGSVNRISM